MGRAGRFGTKGLAISFISTAEDAEQLAAVQSRFEVGRERGREGGREKKSDFHSYA